MPVQTVCPHCKNPCLVSEQFFGTPVGCQRCGKSFIVPPRAAPVPAAVPVAPPQTPRLDIGSATSPGRVRERNEDSFLVQHLTWSHANQAHEVALIVVADGMGGHEGGDQASGEVIGIIGRALTPLLSGALSPLLADTGGPATSVEPPLPEEHSLLTTIGSFLRGASRPASQARVATDMSPAALGRAMNEAVMEANRIVHQKAQTTAGCKGMGATAAVVLIWDSQVQIVHVGDCRVYHQHGRYLTQVTRDQTLVARMIELGQLTASQAASHPARNEVTQAIGRRPILEPGRSELQLNRGDWLIVACDGLQTNVEPAMLQETVGKAPSSAAHLAVQLVALANQQGGSDNCTVVAVRCY